MTTPPDKPDVLPLNPEVLAEAARLVPDARPTPARHGSLGLCTVCLEPAVTHFDSSGQFLGCTEVREGTTFALVAIPGPRARVEPTAPPARPTPTPTPRPDRQFTRARYTLAVPLASLHPDTPPRKMVMKVFAKHPEGVTVSDIRKDTGQANNQVQAVFRWLRAQGALLAKEDTKSS